MDHAPTPPQAPPSLSPDAAESPSWKERLATWCDSFNPEPFFRYGAKFLVWLIYHPKVEGLEHLPKQGPAVIISNHVSYLDGLILNALSPRPIRYVIYRPIYEKPVVNYFMRHNRAIPIFPKKEEVEKALDMISAGLKQGDLICIFPEGQLTYTGHLGRFKPGIEYIVQRDPVPVIPIGLDGLWGSIFSRKYAKSRWPWLPRTLWPEIRAVVGWPVPPEKVKVDKLQKITLKLLERARAL